jgi:hypothetical protein
MAQIAILLPGQILRAVRPTHGKRRTCTVHCMTVLPIATLQWIPIILAPACFTYTLYKLLGCRTSPRSDTRRQGAVLKGTKERVKIRRQAQCSKVQQLMHLLMQVGYEVRAHFEFGGQSPS